MANSFKKKSDETKIKNINSINILEAEIMKTVWDRGSASVREVHESLLRKEMKYKKVDFIPYTTVMSTMIKLAGKGLLKQDKTAKTFLYMAAVDRKELSKNIINSVAEKLLEATTGMVYKFLSNEENVSIDGIEKLLNEIK